MFDMRCRENGIDHRLTKSRHPWTNGQVERMNRTIKEVTVKRDHYDSDRQLEAHLHDFIDAYNHGRGVATGRRSSITTAAEDPSGWPVSIFLASQRASP